MNSMIRWLRRTLGLDRRWSVRYARGAYERTGFYSRREAEAWLVEHGAIGVVCFYDPAVDLRILDDEKIVGEHRPRFVGDSERPGK